MAVRIYNNVFGIWLVVQRLPAWVVRSRGRIMHIAFSTHVAGVVARLRSLLIAWSSSSLETNFGRS